MKKIKRKLNKKGKIVFGILYALAFLLIAFSIFGFINRPVSNDEKNQLVVIEDGDTYSSIASFLKENNLIRSKISYQLYIKLNSPKETLKAGTHYLRKNMTIKDIVNELGKSPTNTNVYSITFKEGLNIRQMASLIEKNTSYTATDFINKIKNKDFIATLIKRYWFLSDEILNDSIYYPLEGYLYPNTYQFTKEASLEDIIIKILNETDTKLKEYKNDFKNSKYTVHQIMTIASMSELEAISEGDREQVARVFYNRVDNNMSLGSDVTTYYAAGINVGQRDLYQTEIDAVNAYNTRSSALAGKLPVGPICNPSISSIKTAINPKNSNYLYFVADKNRKVYFTRTDAEHNQIINKLIKEDLWYTFD